MALSKPKLLPLLPCIAFFLLLLANNVHSRGITTFTFNSLLSQKKHLIFQGDAHIPSGNKSIRLTKTDASGNPQTWSVGRVLYSNPVEFSNKRKQEGAFETTIRFVITAVDNNPADGLAFFMAPVNSTIPKDSGGGNLGIFGSSGTSSSIFAVEFDTYVNPQWDPSFRHIGIDISSRNSTEFTRFEDTFGQVVTARISYEPITKTIRVIATSGLRVFKVRHVFDLKRILPQQVQVGISASTGGGAAVYDIHSWHFTSILV